MGKKLPEAHVSGGIIEAGFEVPGPKKYQPQKFLKDLLREDARPENEVYRRLIRAWPDITEGRLREIIQTVGHERLSKVLSLCELTGKHPSFFEEFLGADCDYKIFDSTFRYWTFVLPRLQALLESFDKRLSVEWSYEVDERKFKGVLGFFLDGAQLPLELFEEFRKPVIGASYSHWPCIKVIEARIKVLQELIIQSLQSQTDSSPLVFEFNELIARYKDLKNSYFKVNPLSFITVPLRYAKEIGHLQRRFLYGNRFELPCAWCSQRRHEIVLIAILEPRRGGETHG
ncbi:MAG: hypothetical protein QW334_04115 [Thermofilum sp.]